MDAKIIKEIIAKYAKVDVDKLDENANLKNDLHLDSIDLFQIVMEVEEKFNVEIDNEKLLDIVTVKDALEKIADAK